MPPMILKLSITPSPIGYCLGLSTTRATLVINGVAIARVLDDEYNKEQLFKTCRDIAKTLI